MRICRPALSPIPLYMRIPQLKSALLAALLLFTPASAQLSISVSKVDSLVIPFTLPQFLSYLEEKIADVDRPVFLERKWEVTREYYQFIAAKREIRFLIESRDIIQAIHNLNVKRQQHADIDDIVVLKSKNELIQKEIDLLRGIESCRLSLLAILQICNVEIISDEQKKTAETAQNTDKRRK